jgi:hypothetical protein
MDVRLLLVCGAVVAASGCVSSNDAERNLNEIVVSDDEMPDGFKLTYQNNADSFDLSK